MEWTSFDEPGLLRDAMLHSPQKATQLGGLLAEQRRTLRALRAADPYDASALVELARRLRQQQREEARLITEIWYEEVGGEG